MVFFCKRQIMTANVEGAGLKTVRKQKTFFHYLPNCIVIIVFLALGRERFLPFGQIHRSQPPAYLAHTSTASLSPL